MGDSETREEDMLTMLNVSQVAARLGVSGQKVRDMCRAGILPARDVGQGKRRYWLVDERNLERWMQEGDRRARR